MARRELALSALLLAGECGCSPPEIWYRPPEQRPSLDSSAPFANTIINTDDPDAAAHFVKDIAESSGTSWRWTKQCPTVKIRLPSVDHVALVVDFALWDVALKENGPVDISFFVNGRLLERVHYTTPGSKHFEKAVPREWLSTDRDTIAAAQISQMYTAKADGAQFGFILSRIGFAQL